MKTKKDYINVGFSTLNWKTEEKKTSSQIPQNTFRDVFLFLYPFVASLNRLVSKYFGNFLFVFKMEKNIFVKVTLGEFIVNDAAFQTFLPFVTKSILRLVLPAVRFH